MLMNSYFLLFLLIYCILFIGLILVDIQGFGTKKQGFSDIFICAVISLVLSSLTTLFISILDERTLPLIYCILAFVVVSFASFYAAKAINFIYKKLED